MDWEGGGGRRTGCLCRGTRNIVRQFRMAIDRRMSGSHLAGLNPSKVPGPWWLMTETDKRILTSKIGFMLFIPCNADNQLRSQPTKCTKFLLKCYVTPQHTKFPYVLIHVFCQIWIKSSVRDVHKNLSRHYEFCESHIFTWGRKLISIHIFHIYYPIWNSM
jgi:hypothetical protein